MTHPIQMFFHCAHCLRQGKPDRIAVGLVDEMTLAVQCDACGRPVGSFELKTPMTMPACSECGKTGHHHHH